MLFGGIGIAPPGVFSDTWLYDGVKLGRGPSGRGSSGAGFRQAWSMISARRRSVLFGGVDAEGQCLRRHLGVGRAPMAQRHPGHPPRARRDASLAYDAQRGVIVLFGGMAATANDRVSQSLNDTWTWDGRNWTQLHPASLPPPRFAASMTYDPWVK